MLGGGQGECAAYGRTLPPGIGMGVCFPNRVAVHSSSRSSCCDRTRQHRAVLRGQVLAVDEFGECAAGYSRRFG